MKLTVILLLFLWDNVEFTLTLQALTCKLSPQSQMSFTPGQRVRVTCGDDQWVKNTELQTADLICQDTGEWDFDPACQRVTCQKIADHVYRWERKYERYWRNEKYHADLGETLWYQCYQEYEATSVRATCTRRGWEPKTLCKEKRCTEPSYTNADIRDSQYDNYNHNDRVTFECTYDKPTVSFYVDCHNGEWRGRVPSCKEKPCATKPSITNGEMLDDQTQRTEYDHGQSLKFRCNGETEPFTVTCQSGLWKKEKSCEDVPCRTKPNITNAEMLSHGNPPYNHGHSVRLRCTGTDEAFSVTCQSGEWMPKNQCREQGACGKAEIANGFSHESQNRLYYTCSPGYKLLSKGWWADASCVEGKWTTQDCVANTDCGPVPEIPNLNATYIGQRFSEGYFIPIQCETGYHNLNVNLTKVTCTNGAWSSNRVDFKRICTRIVQPCNPPPKVRNAVILAPFKKTYLSGTVLTYTCKNDYTLSVEDATVQCNDGSWEQKSIKCLAPSDRELAAKQVVN